MQFKKIARESGIHAWERYVDAGSNADWKAEGVTWVRKVSIRTPDLKTLRLGGGVLLNPRSSVRS